MPSSGLPTNTQREVLVNLAKNGPGTMNEIRCRATSTSDAMLRRGWIVLLGVGVTPGGFGPAWGRWDDVYGATPAGLSAVHKPAAEGVYVHGA